jgi:hypothetical protein
MDPQNPNERQTQETKDVQVPTIGRVVLFHATHLTHRENDVKAATVYAAMWADDDQAQLTVTSDTGQTLIDPATGVLPMARYGESSPGVPAPGCWCWPIMSAKKFPAVPDESGTLRRAPKSAPPAVETSDAGKRKPAAGRKV